MRWLRGLLGKQPEPMHTISQHSDRGDAIVAALDDLPPGGTLYVHAHGCATSGDQLCDCEPETWTNPP